MTTHKPSKLNYMNDGHGTVHIEADEVRCDFCLSDEPRWAFPARTFDMNPVMNEAMVPSPFAATYSNGAWVACNDCAELINARNYDQLSARALDKQGHLVPPVMRADMGRVLKRLHRLFAENRMGGVVPLAEYIKREGN